MKKIALFIFVSVMSGIGIAHAEEAAKTAPTPPAEQASAPAAPASSGVVTVEKIAVGTAIDNKEISGEATQFDNSITRLYCWTKVTADQAPATIKHVWSADGKKEAEVSLDIKYTSARTWSSKSVWPGSWKVDVTDDQGKVLASKEFTVAKEASPPPPPTQVGH